MKKYIYTAVLVMGSIITAYAQRMIPAQKGFELTAGTLSQNSPWRNYYLALGMTVNGKKGNYQLWALEYSCQHAQYSKMRLPIETYSAEGGYSFFLLGDPPRNFALNAAFTAVLGYQSINKGDALLQDGAKIISEDGFLYGAGAGLSFETYLSDRLVLLLKGRIKFFWGTDIEQFRPSAGLGLRYNF
ncbi:conjugal transfer protein TraO [Flavobacterium procerum]|uniref:Conjugal transfer protein TraO n=1 Tax=Flavobacterium procerum TaxID=1455569 RepID=A0ABV6BQT5_9FLAO